MRWKWGTLEEAEERRAALFLNILPSELPMHFMFGKAIKIQNTKD